MGPGDGSKMLEIAKITTLQAIQEPSQGKDSLVSAAPNSGVAGRLMEKLENCWQRDIGRGRRVKKDTSCLAFVLVQGVIRRVMESKGFIHEKPGECNHPIDPVAE